MHLLQKLYLVRKIHLLQKMHLVRKIHLLLAAQLSRKIRLLLKVQLSRKIRLLLKVQLSRKIRLLPVAQLPHGDVDAVEHGHHRPAHQQGADQLGRPLHLKGLDDGGGDDDIEDQEGQLADGLFGQLPDPRQQEADPHQEEKGQDLARHQEETFQHTIPPFRAGRAPHLG